MSPQACGAEHENVPATLGPVLSRDKAGLNRLFEPPSICFANALGGRVVLGVADGLAGPDAFVGTHVSVGAGKQRIWETSDRAAWTDWSMSKRFGSSLAKVTLYHLA